MDDSNFYSNMVDQETQVCSEDLNITNDNSEIERILISCTRIIDVQATQNHVDIQVDIHFPIQQQFSDNSTETEKKILYDKFTEAEDNICFQGFATIKDNEGGLKSLCGVSKNAFNLLLKMCPKTNCEKRKISYENRLTIFLMKMKLNLTFSALSVLFNIHRTTVSDIFKSVLTDLTPICKNFVQWPCPEVADYLMPECFKPKYEKCRVIIDCTEYRVEQPPGIEKRNFFYSQYKKGFRMKAEIGCTPNGHVSFISKLYGGRATDAQITIESGLINLLEPNDVVLADKGFPEIQSVIDSTGKNILLVMPPFLENGEFTAEEVQETKNIASVRIHIERIMARIRIYKILDLITHDLYPFSDDILFMCCVLVNLQPPIIKLENEELDEEMKK